MIPTLSMKGNKRALAMIKELEKIGSFVRGADLHGKGRSDNLNSAEVAEHLIKGGRDFFNTPKTAEAAAEAFADTAEVWLRKMASGARVKAGGVAVRAWRDAMKAAMEAAAENINDGNWVGGGNDELSEAYEDWKYDEYGFAYPIGKATGQLLENLAKSNSGNIRLRKS